MHDKKKRICIWSNDIVLWHKVFSMSSALFFAYISISIVQSSKEWNRDIMGDKIWEVECMHFCTFDAFSYVFSYYDMQSGTFFRRTIFSFC